MHSRWYLKLSLLGAAAGAGMELFMVSTGFYDKVVVIEAQRRADEIQAMEELAAVQSQLPQHNSSSLESRDSVP